MAYDLSGGITRVQASLYVIFSVHIKLKKSDLCKKYRQTVVELAYKEIRVACGPLEKSAATFCRTKLTKLTNFM
jgi:hypothetical protein